MRHCERSEAIHAGLPRRLRLLAMTVEVVLSPALLVDVAEDPAALRNRLDELRAAARIAELLAELGDEHVDDLGLRLIVGATVEMLQQHGAGDDIVPGER